MGVSFANRGSHLEELIQYANGQYLSKGLARIDKVPTPIDPERVTRDGKVFGHYAKKSTVDYIGAISTGVIICFDCKETTDENKLPLKNVHQHQINYMKNIYDMGGIAFIVVYFVTLNKYFRLPFQDLYEYWKVYEAKSEGAKRASGTASIPISAFTLEVISERGFYLHYLQGIVD